MSQLIVPTQPQIIVPPPRNILSPLLATEEDAQLLEIFRQDPALFIERFCMIESEGKVVRFILNQAQRYIYRQAQRMRAAGKPVRIVICKARQLGCSTFAAAYLFAKMRLHTNTNSLMIAHSTATAQEIFKKIKFLHTNLPPEFKPMVQYATKGQLRYDNPREELRTVNPGLMSEIKVATAKDKDAGRGFSFTGIHMSEVSSWPNPEDTFNALINALGDNPETVAFVETTSKGSGDWWNDFWDDCVESWRGGEGEWCPIFLPWFTDKRYQVPLTDAQKAAMILTPYERKLQEQFPPKKDKHGVWQGVTLERVQWYRNHLANKCRNSHLLMKQEMPSTPEESFISKGETIFDLDAISFFLDQPRRRGKTGTLVKRGGRVHFLEDPRGPLTVYSYPSPYEFYCGGCDAAMGARNNERLENGQIVVKRDADFSAATMFSIHREQVAEFQSREVDPMEFAEFLALLGEYYNMALIYPELGGGGNSAGFGMSYRLREIYPNLGMWQKFDHRSPRKMNDYIGIDPNRKTVEIINSLIAQELRRGAGMLTPAQVGEYYADVPPIRIYSKRLLQELSNYQVHKDGSVEAKAGHHDDLVRAFGVTLLGLELLPHPRDLESRARRQEMAEYERYDDLPTDHEMGGWPHWYLQ